MTDTMPDTMRAVDIQNTTGPATALHLSPSVPIPTPSPGQALVKIHAFGLNRMDLLQREGHYPLPPNAPTILGVEFSGTIVSLPSSPASTTNHHSFEVGSPVFGLAPGGAYAEYISVSLRTLLPKPDHLSFVQAAAVPETWMTATQALDFVLGGINDPASNKKKSILWHAGASGVSIAGIQLSRLAGAEKVFATAGTGEKCRFVERELGATKGFNYKTEDWVEGVKGETGGLGVDLVVDFIGGLFPEEFGSCSEGWEDLYAGTDGGRNVKDVDIGALLFKRVRVEGSTLRSRDEEYQGRLRDRLEEYLPRFESGELKVLVDTVLPWEEIVKAHQLLEENKTMGKIICTIS